MSNLEAVAKALGWKVLREGVWFKPDVGTHGIGWWTDGATDELLAECKAECVRRGWVLWIEYAPVPEPETCWLVRINGAENHFAATEADAFFAAFLSAVGITNER